MMLIEAMVHQRKSLVLNLLKEKQKFCWSLHYPGDSSYLFVNGKEIHKFKVDNGIVNFTTQFYLGSMSNGFGAVKSRKVSLKRNTYDSSADCNAIDRSDILSIHKCLMVQSNMK